MPYEIEDGEYRDDEDVGDEIGRGLHPPIKEGTRLTDWGFLAQGRQLGKRVVCPFVSANSASQAQTPTVDMLNIQGNDEHAHQCLLTLCPPEIINTSNLNSAAKQAAVVLQNQTGESGNIDEANTLNQVGGVVGASPQQVSWANPIAIVKWGIGGAECRAEIDFANGITVSLAASWLRVSAMVESSGLSTSTFPYVLRAFVGPGWPRYNPAQRTYVMGPIANGAESSVFTVPRFAKSLRIVASDGSNNPPKMACAVSFWRDPTGPTGGLGVGDFLQAGDTFDPIPIPNGAYFFTVLGKYAASGGGFVTPQYSAIFDLDI